MRLLGKNVLVTGASTGIGRSIAIGAAKEGANVIVNYNSNVAGAQNTIDEIKKIGGKTIAIKSDISKVLEIKEMFKTIRDEYGRLDVLINNAAVSLWARLFEITEEEWDHVIDTNLKGTFFCSVEAASIMKENRGGNIVNVSTNCVELGVKNLVAYTASKGGIHAMTKQLAVELAQYNIRVNTFAPGPTLVERNLRDDPDYNNTWGKLVPLGRAADADEMIGPAIFLASDDSSYMTGQIFYVDGGWAVSGKISMENTEAATRNKSYLGA